ncbi:hypothetical protein [Archangium sp.]|uniref:hypothetical protein n=1 Tax=Archangium sp. TaxID=1872627 RepID=UPI002D33DC42|nr:hypothetical protein [Archangium sp.]HYO57454.1 hypothetical protein [Archangium sp.]
MINQEKSRAEGDLLRKMKDLQGRLDVPFPLPATASKLYQELLRVLLGAIRATVLLTPEHYVRKLLRLESSQDSSKVFELGGTHGIFGGPKDNKRHTIEDIRHAERLVRDDGAVIHFTITVKEQPDGLELIAYDFELYFPSKEPISFVRFDLNPRRHRNDAERAMRSHLHPSHDNLQVPSAMLSPTEALSLLLYGLRIERDAPRG